MEGLAEHYRVQTERFVGPAQFEVAHRWGEGSPVIWRVRSGEGDFALKVHIAADKHSQELSAYETWLPGLEGLAECVPRLRASLQGEPGALLLSWIDGEMWDRTQIEETEEVLLYEKAGSCLARLHRVYVPQEPAATLRVSVREKIVSRAETARTVVGADVSTWAIDKAESDGWDEIPVGYCHRDFSPRNWMVSSNEAGRQLSVLDFEHAAVDYLPMDVMKLWDGPFIGRPKRLRAFYAGYGACESEHVAAIRLLAAAHGLAIVAWSVRAGSEDYLRHGIDFLRRCARDDDWMFNQVRP